MLSKSLYSLARPALFCLDAEQAHELTLGTFHRAPALAALVSPPTVHDPFTLMGLNFVNRVGLAAGLDKNGECLDAWAHMGFGFVEVGTVTPRPQPGNPRPRMFRLPEHAALINRLGFNNKGVDHLLERVARSRYRGVLGINIGKNADTPIERAADDYLIGLRKVYAAASYITVNISSPNTKNLRELQDQAPLKALLGVLADARRELAQAQGQHKPIVVKIAPDMPDEAYAPLAATVREAGMDGIIATNTTLDRAAVAGHAHAAETGGLSGAPLSRRADTVMRLLRTAVGGDFPLIGVGGIGSAGQARARQQAGADLVQVYTGFIYHGPALVRDCASALAR